MNLVPVYETVGYTDANGEPQRLRIVVALTRLPADGADVKPDAVVG